VRAKRHSRNWRPPSTGGSLDGDSEKSAGPAITNAATGILVARDGWPLLVLGGRRPLHMREMGSFQELDGVALYRPITKFADLITSAENIPLLSNPSTWTFSCSNCQRTQVTFATTCKVFRNKRVTCYADRALGRRLT